MFRNISIAVVLLILFIVLWYVMYITFHDVESVEIMLSYIGIAIAVIAIFVGSFISSSIKINDNFSEIYEIGVDAYNSNDLYKGNDVFFRKKILKEVKGEVLTLKEQEMRKEVIQKKLQPKEITSEKIRYSYFLKKSIILKKDADSSFKKLQKFATVFVYCLIISLIFIITKNAGHDLFIAFEIPLALWILEDLFESYNNEKQINYEKVNKFIEVTGKLYDSGELKEYQELQEYYEYLLGIYDYDHVEDSNLEPLLPSRYRNKL